MALINERGWTDIGNDETKCQGNPGKATCTTSKDAAESRIDFILANNRMTPAITKCYVDDYSDFPIHKPLIIEIMTKLLENTSRELKKPTNFASMLNQKIDEEAEEVAVKLEENKAIGNDTYEAEKEHSIRHINIEGLHQAMDQAIDKRKHRLDYAALQRDTDTQWDLIAAGVEEGVIDFFKLQGKEATKMRGRSKITFDNKTKRLLQGIEDDEANADLVSRATWLRTAANCHTKLGNRIINLARTMKPCNNAAAEMDRQKVTGNTAKAYVDLATKSCTKANLTEDQKKTIKANWKGKRQRVSKSKATKDCKEPNWDETFEEFQQFGKQMLELLEQMQQCDLNNGIHAAKLTRCGEAHNKLAQQYFAKAK